MGEYEKKPKNDHYNTVSNNASKQLKSVAQGYLVDNRPKSVAQRKTQQALNTSSLPKQTTPDQPVQLKANKTGLPDGLKTGIESISGHSLDDVKVHYNSSAPAQLQAHAFAQGSQIHLAPGQEKHLPHEAWHVVQQKQGRVSPTMQMKGKVNINDNKGLEHEADTMGAKLAYSAKQAGPEQSATLNHTTITSRVIQGVFTQNIQTFEWTDTDTGKVYQQTSTMANDRVSLTGHGESFVIRRDTGGTWNRLTQEGRLTLTPHRDRAYRVHAHFEGFDTIDKLKEQEELPKDDLPYSAHGIIRNEEYRNFFSDIPSLPKDQKPSPEYLKLLKERTHAYRTLAQPKPPKKGSHKRPWKSDTEYGFSFDTSSGLPFHQADDLIKSSYQRKDKKKENLSIQDIYEAGYLSNFNRIVPDSTLYSPFTQTQQTGHWLDTLGPTLDVNSPPTIKDKSAGTDYKGVYSVFKNFLDKLSDNPEFVDKTVEDTQLFLSEQLKNLAIEAHKEAYLGSANKTKSKAARGEGGKTKKRRTLAFSSQQNIEKAHDNITSFISGGDPKILTAEKGKNVQKIAYLFYIKLIKRAITNVIILMHSNREDLDKSMQTLLSQFQRLAELQSKLYTGSTDKTSDSDDEYEPFIPQEVQQLAQQNDVQAHYGGSSGNNCLIYAIAGAFGVILSAQQAATIRTWLNNNSAQRGHFSPHGQLPMLPGLIQEITNQLMHANHQINGNITVVTTGGNFAAQGAVGNNENNGNVLVILHGAHYYFTQPIPEN